MQIVLIGTGNVATVLGRKLQYAGHSILQVYGRNLENAEELAALLNSNAVDDLYQITHTADCYMMAVADTAIPTLAGTLRLDKKLIVHTAGSVSMHVLKNCSRNYGVLYPLQSLRREMTDLPVIPFLVDGNTEEDKTLITDLARTISDQVRMAGDEERLKLHVAAVMVSNFTNHLYTLARQYCEKEQMDFRLLLPLIKEVAVRLQHLSPQQSQTGPAIRHDTVTIDKHLALLKEHPALQEWYRLFTKSIFEMHPLNKPATGSNK